MVKRVDSSLAFGLSAQADPLLLSLGIAQVL